MTTHNPYANAQTLTIGRGALADKCIRFAILDEHSGRSVASVVGFFRGEVNENLFIATKKAMSAYGTAIGNYAQAMSKNSPGLEGFRNASNLAERVFNDFAAEHGDESKANNETAEAHLLAATGNSVGRQVCRPYAPSRKERRAAAKNAQRV